MIAEPWLLPQILMRILGILEYSHCHSAFVSMSPVLLPKTQGSFWPCVLQGYSHCSDLQAWTGSSLNPIADASLRAYKLLPTAFGLHVTQGRESQLIQTKKITSPRGAWNYLFCKQVEMDFILHWEVVHMVLLELSRRSNSRSLRFSFSLSFWSVFFPET